MDCLHAGNSTVRAAIIGNMVIFCFCWKLTAQPCCVKVLGRTSILCLSEDLQWRTFLPNLFAAMTSLERFEANVNAEDLMKELKCKEHGEVASKEGQVIIHVCTQSLASAREKSACFWLLTF